ncbi:hypothetical protein [Candidatus Trichorickettsia mobilis]|uniref:hypothetical protein n=1 Tax=Candidatus Trichorickettsia mobilis TaxID=1346319 RepID=UPI0029318AD0|nr:hypothetical protein [Candidatus Trichorickettsia mobilis]
MSKHPIYIGTGEHNIPGQTNETQGISIDCSIQLKDGHLFLDLYSTKDPNFADILDTLIHEATHTACREFFANGDKPYSKQISRSEEQKFAELYNTLVRQTPISTVLLSSTYHSIKHEVEFIARFIGQYTYYCVKFKGGSAISFQEFAPQYLSALLSVEQYSAEEQQETGRLLQQFAEYLDNSQGFIKSAHNSLQKLEEIAAIDDASVEVTEAILPGNEAILELMGSDNYGDHI